MTPGVLLAKMLALETFSLWVSSSAALSSQAVTKPKVVHVERPRLRVTKRERYLASPLPGQL